MPTNFPLNFSATIDFPSRDFIARAFKRLKSTKATIVSSKKITSSLLSKSFSLPVFKWIIDVYFCKTAKKYLKLNSLNSFLLFRFVTVLFSPLLSSLSLMDGTPLRRFTSFRSLKFFVSILAVVQWNMFFVWSASQFLSRYQRHWCCSLCKHHFTVSNMKGCWRNRPTANEPTANRIQRLHHNFTLSLIDFQLVLDIFCFVCWSFLSVQTSMKIISFLLPQLGIIVCSNIQ